MSNKRKLVVAAFALFTIVCVVWLIFAWVSVNLLSFPCSSPEVPEPCSEVVPRVFFLKALLPTIVVWAPVAWLTFRRWDKR